MNIPTFTLRHILALALVAAMAILSGCAMPGPKQPTTPPPAQKPDVSQVNIALLMPASGGYAAIGDKIISGAKLAVNESNAKNPKRRIGLKVIKAEGDWVTQIRNLPPSYAVVGGPLQEGIFRQALQAGLTSTRAFFTFTGKLDPGVEGSQAWRFFPSAEDQVDAVVRFADELNIRTMASILPGNAAGSRLEGILERRLASKGITLKKATYAGNDVVALNTTVNGLAGTGGFESVFLSCSWKQMSGVIASFDAMGTHGLVLFGTMLWDGFLANRAVTVAESALPVYPGAYVHSVAPPALANGAYDYWAALGYDFVRFANRLNMKQRLPSAQISERARQATRMNFAMAPITFDSRGTCQQKLFMLQPGAEGATLANREDIQARRTLLREDLGPDGLPRMTSDDGTLPSPETTGPEVTPGSPAATDVKPYSSYKLRLPGAN